MEMADIVRDAGQDFVERSRRWINGQHEKVLAAIVRCRTAALGGHRDQCSGCGHTAISYNSCRNRHCPKCQGNARIRWLQQRERELLPTRYVHAVFTMPRELAPLALQNKQVIYGLLFRASAATLLEGARDPRAAWARRSASSACFIPGTSDSSIILTSTASSPPEGLHRIMPAGSHRAAPFFLPVKVLGRVFRGKFLAGLRTAFREGRLEFHGHLAPLAEPRRFAAWLRVLFRHDWVVYSKRPFGGPEHTLRYLGAYTHRVGIANSRLVSFTDGRVSFRWRDSAHNNRRRVMSLPADEFLRRFLLHLLPPGFVRIRNFGFLANRQRAKLLPLCFRLLGTSVDRTRVGDTADEPKPSVTLPKCPLCSGTMRVVERFSSAQLLPRSPPQQERCAA